MTIVVVGLNHHTAPVELRERLALSGCALSMALEDLRSLTYPDTSSSAAGEAVILSTCNRLEIYASVHQPAAGIAAIEQFLSGLQNIPPAELAPYLYHYNADDAITHLMHVACGLDSMILGEPQILGQVTQAFEDAHAAGMTGPILSHLFAQAIHTGKRARTETPISRFTTSVSHVGALKIMDELPGGGCVLVVGAGEMAMLAAQAIRRADVADQIEIAFINRTYQRAEVLAGGYMGWAFTWYQLDEALTWADAVICATGAPHTVIYRRDIEAVMHQREKRPLVIVDVAVPRDVEASVRELPDVHYSDIDNLQSVIDQNMEMRKAAVPQVEAIIQEEMQRFDEWYLSRQVTPVIKTLRDWAQSVADSEVDHTLTRLPDADERTRQLVSRLAYRLVNRLLHEPTTRLRLQAAEGNGYGYAHAIRELFALNDVEALECQQDSTRCMAAGQTDRSNELPALCNLQCIMPPAAGAAGLNP